MHVLEDAIIFATRTHQDQVDAQGQPYILHPLRVMFAVREKGGSEAAQVAAVLHDTVEDVLGFAPGLTEIARAFGVEVSSLVEALSRIPESEDAPEESYPEFIERVIRAGTDAMLIKFCDMADNLARVTGIEDEAKRARLTKKYKNGLARLKEVMQ